MKTVYYVIAIAAATMLFGLLALSVTSCKTACLVADTAHDVCLVVQYSDDAGMHSVQMPTEDLKDFARLEAEMAKARAERDRASDGGADASSR